MKKENQQVAKRKRAEERRRQARIKMYKKIAAWTAPVLAAVLIIAALFILNEREEAAANAASASTSESSSSLDTGSDESSAADSSTSATDAVLNTDTSLEIADGDTVNIDYVGTIDGVAFDGGSTNGAGADLVIGSNSYIDDYEAQLIGAHPGDTVDVNVTFPDDYHTESLQGKDALFVVTVNGIYK